MFFASQFQDSTPKTSLVTAAKHSPLCRNKSVSFISVEEEDASVVEGEEPPTNAGDKKDIQTLAQSNSFPMLGNKILHHLLACKMSKEAEMKVTDFY